MTWPIDVQALEQAIVRNCSPTLAAIKPASLFTFPGSFVAEAPEGHRETAARRQAFLEAVKYCQRQVSSAGVAIRVLAWKRCGALVYVYRPQELAAHLEDPRAKLQLDRKGYPAGNTENLLDELSRRLQLRPGANEMKVPDQKSPCPCSNKSCRSEFPHEIGFFLGYPHEDVIGFIENHGQGYTCCGAWKSYGDPVRARRYFDRCRACTDNYKRRYAGGAPLTSLIVAA